MPESWQRSGGPRGYFVIEFDGNSYKDTFKAIGMAAEKQMSIDLLTPEFEDWFRQLSAWRNEDPNARKIPPFNINDLPDTKQVLTSELEETYLSVNVWNGSQDSTVEVSFSCVEGDDVCTWEIAWDPS